MFLSYKGGNKIKINKPPILGIFCSPLFSEAIFNKYSNGENLNLFRCFKKNLSNYIYWLPPSVSSVKMTLFDLLGRAVVGKEEDIAGQTTEILRGSLQSGMYILRIEDQRGYVKIERILLE